MPVAAEADPEPTKTAEGHTSLHLLRVILAVGADDERIAGVPHDVCIDAP